MSQQGLIFCPTEKLKPKGQISETHLKNLMIMIIIIIIIIIMNLLQETTVFGGNQKLTSAMKQRPEPEVYISGWDSTCQPYIESATALSDT